MMPGPATKFPRSTAIAPDLAAPFVEPWELPPTASPFLQKSSGTFEISMNLPHQWNAFCFILIHVLLQNLENKPVGAGIFRTRNDDEPSSRDRSDG
jgi:hypothetical protein